MARESIKKSKMLVDTDRISALPNNVIDIILSCVPLRDAVRTSILSSKWRLHWTRVENVVLDRDFFDDIRQRKQMDEMSASTYVGIVSKILLCHSGPIRKFILHVPDFDETLDVVNLWVLAVSRHGVHDLKLDFVYTSYYEGPSYVFQCLELKHLSLQNVRRPPRNFGQLSSLLSLDRGCETIYGDLLTNMVLCCPLLERLSLCYAYKRGSFAINAPRLKVFQAVYYVETNFVLINTPNLSTITLISRGSLPDDDSKKKWPDVTKFFGAVPKIENITITEAVLAEWGVQDVPKMLPAPLKNHLSLIVCWWNLYSLAQVRSMFCLMNSSPVLQKLNISVRSNDLFYRPHETSNYLKSQIRDAENSWGFRTVEIAGLMGEEPELLFIQLILSFCPVLEKLILFGHPCISSDAEYKMMTDIMEFSQASTQAKMTYSKAEASDGDGDSI